MDSTKRKKETVFMQKLYVEMYLVYVERKRNRKEEINCVYVKT